MSYLTAPRMRGVWCTQCGEFYAMEPDRCVKCGCPGFQTKKEEPRLATTPLLKER